MRLKQKPQDFRVKEILREGFLLGRGDHRVYRVTKSKATSFEAARDLAEMAGVQARDVSMAGLKDRQGITDQFMTIPRGKEVYFSRPELKIEPVGFSQDEITSKDSEGNHFEIVSRGLEETQLIRMRAGLDTVREFGYTNYFDEQRFGNLRHGQGWIALDLLRGDTEGGLKRMLGAQSLHDSAPVKHFKEQVWRRWGNWKALREIAGRYGKHHSVFDHLRHEPGDFAGAFKHLATRERVIHQFAFQSHIWNRALSFWLKDAVPEPKRFTLPGIEGPLVFVKGPIPIVDGWGGCLPLPGVHLLGCKDELQVSYFEKALSRYDLDGAGFEIPNVPGFGFKTDDRPLAIQPQNLRARPAEPDALNVGYSCVKFSFELPRGAYASLLIKRLLGIQSNEDQGYDPRRTSQSDQQRYDEGAYGERPRGGSGHHRGYGPGDRGGYGGDRRDDYGGAPRRSRGGNRGGSRGGYDRGPRDRDGEGGFEGSPRRGRDAGGPRRSGGAAPRRRGGPPSDGGGRPPKDGESPPKDNGYKRPF
jgi:tRNA pseudouridine13 synthase